MSLPDRPVNLFLPKFCPKVTQPLLILGVGDIRWYCAGMVRDSKIATPPSLFRMVAANIADPLRPPILQKWGPKCTLHLALGTTSRSVLPPSEYGRRCILHTTGDVAFCQIKVSKYIFI